MNTIENKIYFNELSKTIIVEPICVKYIEKLNLDIGNQIWGDIQDKYKVRLTYPQKYKFNPFIKRLVNYCLKTPKNNEYFESIGETNLQITYEYVKENENFIWVEISSNCMCGGITLRFKNIVNASHHW